MSDDPQFVIIPAHLFRLELSNTALLVAGRVNRLIQQGQMPGNVIPLKKLVHDLQISRTAINVGLRQLEKAKVIEREEVSRLYVYKWRGTNDRA